MAFKKYMVSKPQNISNLFSEIKLLIEEARQAVAVTLNAATTLLYWNIGERVNKDLLWNKWAQYGKEVVKSLSSKLTKEYGKRWSENHFSIVSALRRLFPRNRLSSHCVDN